MNRLCWLLNQGVEPSRIFVVSFTRASANDLKERVISACEEGGHAAAVTHIQVSTLHSLALRALRAGGLLARFPTQYPLVLDEWELENIFDPEFGASSAVGSRMRQREIRRYHEAMWSTGVPDPPNYIPPDPAITTQEANDFAAFHTPRTQTYACVLPGEIVRQCVEEMNAGNLDVVGLLHMEHLIVDEFQDLNPMDLEFVDLIIQRGVTVFMAGDDDQSVYSFRFANPAGIQQIPQKYPAAGLHQLTECFRSMPKSTARGRYIDRCLPTAESHCKESALALLAVTASACRNRALVALYYGTHRSKGNRRILSRSHRSGHSAEANSYSAE